MKEKEGPRREIEEKRESGKKKKRREKEEEPLATWTRNRN